MLRPLVGALVLAADGRFSVTLAAASLAALPAVALAQAARPTVPLCPGLTIVTAVNQQDGDYESIKTIESVTDQEVRLKYSAERLVQDVLLDDLPRLQKIDMHRTVRRADLQSAKLYQQQFSTELPELMPDTTAIGTSAAVLDALRRTGQAELGIFIPYSQYKPSIDRNVHPNVYDNQMVAPVRRTGVVTLPVIVNDVRVDLPAVQAAGDFFGDKSEFFFLDDERNPMALKFRVGIDAIAPLDAVSALLCADLKKNGSTIDVLPGGVRCDQTRGRDRDTLRVVKIAYRCAAPPAPAAGKPGAGAGAGAAGAGAAPAVSALEKALAETGRADVYSIYFSFGSDTLREESEPTLREIAELLRRHPDWKLAVNGHTDNIAGDAFNLKLSQARAAAVKGALTKRHGIDAARLATGGFGESQPKDTNETLEGRARNRRVELVRS